MSGGLPLLAAAWLALAGQSAQAPLGPHADACRPGAPGPALTVTVRGFRAPTGHIQVYLYGSDPAAFLQRGRWLHRIELPVTSTRPMRVCLPAPSPGSYAVSVRHDVDGNRERRDANDGGGFSRNPRLSLLRLEPRLRDVAVQVRPGVQPLDVVLNYRFGLTVRPVRP